MVAAMLALHTGLLMVTVVMQAEAQGLGEERCKSEHNIISAASEHLALARALPRTTCFAAHLRLRHDSSVTLFIIIVCIHYCFFCFCVFCFSFVKLIKSFKMFHGPRSR